MNKGRPAKHYNIDPSKVRALVSIGKSENAISKDLGVPRHYLNRVRHEDEQIRKAWMEGQAQHLGEKLEKSGIVDKNWTKGRLSPGEPMQPSEPNAQVQDSKMFQYGSTFNRNVIPGSEIPGHLSFAQLRLLADKSPILRSAIEARKAQIRRLKWGIRPKNHTIDPEQHRNTKRALKLLRKPDGLNSFTSWQAAILEDLFVLDNACIVPVDDGDGLVFQLVDPSTIKRVLNSQGRTPKPPYVAYQQVILGRPEMNFTTDEMMVIQANPSTNRPYGLSKVEACAEYALLNIDRLTFQRSYFSEGTLPESMIMVPENWNSQQVAEFQLLWDQFYEGPNSLMKRARTKFLENGMELIQAKHPDFTVTLEEHIARTICSIFQVSPSMLVSDNNRATADSSKETGEMDGLIPLMNLFEDMMNNLLHDFAGLSDVEFYFDQERAINPGEQSIILERYVKLGIMTIDEARLRLGMEALQNSQTLAGDETPLQTQPAQQPTQAQDTPEVDTDPQNP